MKDGIHYPVSAPRPARSMGLFRRLRLARENLLSAWSDAGYEKELQIFKILRQQYVVCNSPQTVRQVFLQEHDNYDRKSPQMRHALEPLLGDGLFVSDGELWKSRRAYCAPAFENELLPGYVNIMVTCAKELVGKWQQLPAGTQVDMLNEMARLTAQIIGRTIFGDNTSDEEAAQVVRGFTQYQRQVEQLDMADALGVPFLRWFRNPVRQWKTRRSAAEVHDVIDRIIDRYRAEDRGQSFSLISLLLEGEKGTGETPNACPLGYDAARNEAIVMFMAGHETTANSLAWAWYLLDRYPASMHKLQKEVDRVLQGRSPTLADVERLHYTRAVFEETLRLYPPVPLLSRQARASGQIQGKGIEKGAIILVVPWLLHRHVKLWDNPGAFDPDRFMPGAPRPDKYAYIPFSVGRRVCLGKRFGLVEGILCLAILAQSFAPKKASGREVQMECRLTLRPKDGLPMQLVPR